MRVSGVSNYLTFSHQQSIGRDFTDSGKLTSKVLTAGITEEHGALLVPVTVSTGGIFVTGRLH